ncbi:Rab effector Noc2 [Nymphon striatum]|nr:Rab effector Noc2 [Nymphon striatum]
MAFSPEERWVCPNDRQLTLRAEGSNAPMIMSSLVKERAVVNIRATAVAHSDIADDLFAIHGISGADHGASLHGIGKATVLKIAKKGGFSLSQVGNEKSDMKSVEALSQQNERELRTGWCMRTSSLDRYYQNKGIDDAEQERIVEVIKRAENVDNNEQLRVGRLVERLENMKKNAMGNGQNECILCADKFGLLGATALTCNDCKKILKKSGAWFLKGMPRYVLPEKQQRFKYNRIGTCATATPTAFAADSSTSQQYGTSAGSVHQYTTWIKRGHLTESSGAESEESSDDDPSSRMASSLRQRLQQTSQDDIRLSSSVGSTESGSNQPQRQQPNRNNVGSATTNTLSNSHSPIQPGSRSNSPTPSMRQYKQQQGHVQQNMDERYRGQLKQDPIDFCDGQGQGQTSNSDGQMPSKYIVISQSSEYPCMRLYRGGTLLVMCGRSPPSGRQVGHRLAVTNLVPAEQAPLKNSQHSIGSFGTDTNLLQEQVRSSSPSASSLEKSELTVVPKEPISSTPFNGSNNIAEDSSIISNQKIQPPASKDQTCKNIPPKPKESQNKVPRRGLFGLGNKKKEVSTKPKTLLELALTSEIKPEKEVMRSFSNRK